MEIDSVGCDEDVVKKVYYAARDGFAITLYVILNDKSQKQTQYILNQVGKLLFFTLFFCD